MDGQTDEPNHQLLAHDGTGAEVVRYVETFDVVHAQLTTECLQAAIGDTVATGLAVPGAAYAAYLADGQEAGTPLHGTVWLDLPAGAYTVALYAPVGGPYAPAIAVQGGQPV